jgi:hypothetical protein
MTGRSESTKENEMIRSKRILMVGTAAMMLSMAAIAAVATASWTNATKNTDGTDIPASGAGSLVSTTVEWATCGAGDTFGTKAGEVVTASPGTTRQTPDLLPGRWCFRAFHTNTYGSTSDPTPVVVKVVAAPKPNPPTNFSVN